MAKKSKPKKKFQFEKEHIPFMGLLLLFSAFSLYGIASFFDSTNDYIANIQASVTDSDNVVTEERAAAEVTIFTDMDSAHRNFQAVSTLYNNGIVNGYEDGSFRPEDKMTRAAFWVLVTNAIDADLAGGELRNCFEDVEEEWFAPFVCYAKGRGWVSGLADGDFGPEGEVTKAQAVKMVLNAFEYSVPESVEESSYIDVEISDWYSPYAEIAQKRKLFSSSRTFSPDYVMSRADVSQLIYNAMLDKGMLR